MKKPNVNFDDFVKLDIRVGEINKCEIVKKSNKLLKLTVDFGQELGKTTILTGLAKYYQPKDFEEKKFLFIVNLEPKKIIDDLSNGMIIVANVNETPTIFEVGNNLPNGSHLY